ncbi:MAG: hypothetical protein IJN59_04130, partial [Oscillospiraceae bacterium]|nr:hypothetical protein [Oscillospiraceae bacterium]
MKAYIKNGEITLVSDNGKQLRFAAGSVLTTMDVLETKQNPYALFQDYQAESFRKFVTSVLDSLYKLGKAPATTLLADLDAQQTDKLYINRDWKLSFELVDGQAITVFFIESARDLLALELITIVNCGKLLKKCGCCGNYFFPEGRSDTQYCSRIGKDGYACKKIGANRHYRKQSRADSVKTLYDKVTKHNRYLKSKGLLTEAEYSRWITEAAAMHARFKNGTISAESLSSWLSDELPVVSRPQRRNE